MSFYEKFLSLCFKLFAKLVMPDSMRKIPDNGSRVSSDFFGVAQKKQSWLLFLGLFQDPQRR